jgi:hypothetical protein
MLHSTTLDRISSACLIKSWAGNYMRVDAADVERGHEKISVRDCDKDGTIERWVAGICRQVGLNCRSIA